MVRQSWQTVVVPKPSGRPNGYLLYARGFEGALKLSKKSKRQVAELAGVSPSFLSDLLAYRGGATGPIAARIAAAVGVDADQLFPEMDGWVGPLPNRTARRKAVA